MRQPRHAAGDTLVEVVISLAILTLTLAVAYNVANLSYHVGVQARESTVAAQLLQDQAEKLRAYRDTQVAADPQDEDGSDIFSAFNTGAAQPYYLNASDAPVSGAVAEDTATCTASGVHPCTASASICEGLPTCLLRDNITKTVGAQNNLNEISATISVSWTSLVGKAKSTSKLTYYLTDTRLINPCDNSVAGASCQ